MLEEINNKIEEIKSKIDEIVNECDELSKNKRFKEALSKLDTIDEIIGKQDLPEEKKKIQAKRKEILEAQEDYIKFADDLKDVEKQLQENLQNNNLAAAQSNCDLLIQIAESSDDNKLVDKYTKILNEINKKIEELKNKIDESIDASGLLSAKLKFDDALTNIDAMLENIKGQEFPEYQAKLEDRKREILEAKKDYDETFKDIQEIDKKLEANLKMQNIGEALENLDLIRLQLAGDEPDDNYLNY